MKIKRICIYGCTEIFGGTEQYLMTIYRAIDRTKLQFDFLFPHNANKISYESEIENLGGRVYREYYNHSERKIPGAISPRDLFRKHPEWSGIYVNWQSIDTAYQLIIAAKKEKRPYRVIHAHNNGYNRSFNLKDKIYEKFFHMTKQCYVTDYLACSDLAGKWLFHTKGFTVIPNAVPFEKYTFSKPLRKKIRKECSIKDSETLYGFCGRLVEQKNPDFLLEIFKYILQKQPTGKLLIVGDGQLREKLEDKIKKEHLDKKVTITGMVPNVEDYMQAMDCFILPSRFEGFGIVLLEAQAAGLPCFTSKNVVPKETNLTGHVRFLGLDDGAKVWADKIMNTNLTRYDSMDELLKSDYTVEKSVKRIMRVFEC
ncbi:MULTISPECIES: glycosyltransferase [Lachnospiraceae]|uniref:Glycosyltransferase family 1 protein n=1 Tax=Coprococcus comes TaxID=410072 RepID=A0A3R6DLC0_9FIRM|nr:MULTISPECIES: glycosyltransferase [Coprococcus]RHF81782.1 glycosyltransferase family 1 protein [Coprococcus comes]